MRFMGFVGVLIPFMVVLGCGSTDDTGSNSAGEKACQDLSAKLTSCGLSAPGACNSTHPCEVECGAKAECAQLKENPPSGPLLQCIAACSGAAPDDFICKDATGYVKKAGVCDGKFQCQDGSDEANCGDAG